MTTKISWNQFNSIPDDLFRWRGIDGSEVLTYFVNTPSEGQDSDTRYATYNGMVTPHAVIGSWKKFKNKELSSETLISYGYGDGGGGVTRDMLELRRAMDVIPGLPKVKAVQAKDFFRGCMRMWTKRIATSTLGMANCIWNTTEERIHPRHTIETNRRLENKLARTEWLSSLSYILGGNYAQQELNKSWECVLLHQFHDIIRALPSMSL